MSRFICQIDGCPNKGIVYDFGDESPAWAECGGCKARLEAQSE